MPKRTLDNCQLIKTHGKTTQYDNGTCEGHNRGDNPHPACVRCKLFAYREKWYKIERG